MALVKVLKLANLNLIENTEVLLLEDFKIKIEKNNPFNS